MSSKPSKPSWVEDMAVDDSSDLEESWAGEEVMFDGSPSSGMCFHFWLFEQHYLTQNYQKYFFRQTFCFVTKSSSLINRDPKLLKNVSYCLKTNDFEVHF